MAYGCSSPPARRRPLAHRRTRAWFRTAARPLCVATTARPGQVRGPCCCSAAAAAAPPAPFPVLVRVRVHVVVLRPPPEVLLVHVRLHNHPQALLPAQELQHLHERFEQLVAQLHHQHSAAQGKGRQHGVGGTPGGGGGGGGGRVDVLTSHGCFAPPACVAQSSHAMRAGRHVYGVRAVHVVPRTGITSCTGASLDMQATSFAAAGGSRSRYEGWACMAPTVAHSRPPPCAMPCRGHQTDGPCRMEWSVQQYSSRPYARLKVRACANTQSGPERRSGPPCVSPPLGPMPPHQQVLLRARVRKVELSSTCIITRTDVNPCLRCPRAHSGAQRCDDAPACPRRSPVTSSLEQLLPSVLRR